MHPSLTFGIGLAALCACMAATMAVSDNHLQAQQVECVQGGRIWVDRRSTCVPRPRIVTMIAGVQG